MRVRIVQRDNLTGIRRISSTQVEDVKYGRISDARLALAKALGRLADRLMDRLFRDADSLAESVPAPSPATHAGAVVSLDAARRTRPPRPT